MLLVLFCLIFGSLNLLFYRIKNRAFALQQISIPAHVQIKEQAYHGQDKKQDRKKGSAADYFLDSLSSTASGKRIVDSLRQLRPGLLDSLAAFKNKIHNHF